jgi:hypothetical protein
MNTPNLPAPPPSTRQRPRRLLDTATAGLGMGRGPHITPDGPQFTLVRGDGASYTLPTMYVDFVVCDVLEHSSRLLYPPNSYSPNSEDPPVCFSDNGTGPSVNAMQPQSPLCETCQWNVRGTAQTVTGQPTTLCKPSKKIAVFIPDDPQLNLYEIKIGAGSLANFRAYCQWIGQQTGELDIADFITRMSQDPQKKNTYLFEAVGWARGNDQLEAKLEYIETNRLGDAIVNRTDRPCEPEAVARMLAMRGSSAALLGPASSQPAQSFQLPPPSSPMHTVAGPAPVQVPPTPPAQGPAPSHFQPPQQGGFGARQEWRAPSYGNDTIEPPPPVQQWQPAPGQTAETRQEATPVTRTRKPRTPKGQTPDPQAQGFQAPAQATQQGFQRTSAGFSPPGFIAQQLPPGPGTRLQEPANVNPAPQPQFGMQQAGAPPQSLADAMRMLPPRQ